MLFRSADLEMEERRRYSRSTSWPPPPREQWQPRRQPNRATREPDPAHDGSIFAPVNGFPGKPPASPRQQWGAEPERRRSIHLPRMEIRPEPSQQWGAPNSMPPPQAPPTRPSNPQHEASQQWGAAPLGRTQFHPPRPYYSYPEMASAVTVDPPSERPSGRGPSSRERELKQMQSSTRR